LHGWRVVEGLRRLRWLAQFGDHHTGPIGYRLGKIESTLVGGPKHAAGGRYGIVHPRPRGQFVHPGPLHGTCHMHHDTTRSICPTSGGHRAGSCRWTTVGRAATKFGVGFRRQCAGGGKRQRWVTGRSSCSSQHHIGDHCDNRDHDHDHASRHKRGPRDCSGGRHERVTECGQWGRGSRGFHSGAPQIQVTQPDSRGTSNGGSANGPGGLWSGYGPGPRWRPCAAPSPPGVTGPPPVETAR